MTEKKEIELIKARIEFMLQTLEGMGEGKGETYRMMRDASMHSLEMLADYIRFIEGELL